MAQQLYNVALSATTSAIPEWRAEVPCWEVLYSDAHMSTPVNPLTVKARYVTGIVLAHCRSVEILLGERHLISTTYVPALGVFASAVDLLGRCINGDSNPSGNNNENLWTGFKWLHTPDPASYQSVSKTDILVTTSNGPHTIEELFYLRHYSVHGQAINKAAHTYGADPNRPVPVNRHADCPIQDLDYLILGELPLVMGTALEAYLSELKTNNVLAAKLAKAGVLALLGRPVFDSAWDFPADTDLYPRAIGDGIRSMDWTYKQRIDLAAVACDMSL